MSKRKRGPSENGSVLEETFEEPTSSKRMRVEPEVNGFSEDGIPDKLEYWIVRKPKAISIADMPVMRMPKKFPASDRSIVRTDVPDEYLNCKFYKTSKQTFYLDRKQARYSKTREKNVVKPGIIRGIVMMQPEDADTYIGPVPPEEDFQDYEKCTTAPPEVNFTIPSIRRLPASTESAVERLKAFGCKRKNPHAQHVEAVEMVEVMPETKKEPKSHRLEWRIKKEEHA